MGRSNLIFGLAFISLNILVGTSLLINAAIHEDRTKMILGGPVLVIVAGYSVYLYLWFLWTRPIDALTIANGSS